MKRLALTILRALYRTAGRLDRANLPLFGWLPAHWKRHALRTAFRLASPLLPGSVAVGGVRLAAPRSHFFAYVLEPHEPEVVDLFERHLDLGMTAIDVGANIGYMTLQLARCVGTEGRVLALEPAPDNLVWLRRNVELNRSSQVEIVAAGAGASSTRGRLTLDGGSTRYALRRNGEEGDVGVTTEVDVVALDDLVDEPVHLVKIDVEGWELEVLRGMRQLLATSRDLKLIVEWNPPLLERGGARPEELIERLVEAGFEVRLIGTDGDLEPLTTERAAQLAADRTTRDGWYGNLFAFRRREGGK